MESNANSISERLSDWHRESEYVDMQICGIEKTSLIDFAPRISCVLFTQGCNLRCPYCHNPELVPLRADSGTIPGPEILSFLEKRKQYLEGVVISGGEPTLQPDLIELCQAIKSMGYAIKIDTNGTRPDVLQKLITGKHIDYIAMDVKTDPENYSPVFTSADVSADILASMAVILKSNIDHEFRTTCVKPVIDRAAISSIARYVQGARLYALQNPVVQKPLDPAFFDKKDRFPSQSEMTEFCSILSQSVTHCIIR